MRGLVTALALGASCLCACSLVELSADIEQGRCQSHDDCDVLNTESVLDEDACVQWQCDRTSELCALLPLDRDYDQQSPAEVEHDGETFMCEADPEQQDCDDDDLTRAQGLDESCDRRDNDCDGRYDEGALVPSADPIVELGSAESTHVAYARDADSGAVAVAYSLLSASTPAPGFSLLAPALDQGVAARSLAVQGIPNARSAQVAVAALGSDRFAYAFVNVSGAERLVAGIVDPSDERIQVGAAMAMYGVSCLQSEPCAANAMAPPDVVPAPNRSAPALAALGDDVLLGYLRWDGDEPSCGELVGAAELPELVANLLERRGEQLTESSSEAVSFGRSSDLSAPAIVALDELGSGAERASAGWLVAHSDGGGRVVVDRVQAEGTTLAITQRELVGLADAELPSSGVTLALSPPGPTRQLAVAYQRGCGGDARVLVSLYALTIEDGELRADPVAEEIATGGDAAAGNAALAFSPENPSGRGMWAVAYRDRRGLRARLIDLEGVLQDEAGDPYLLIDTGPQAAGDTTSVLLTPALLPLPSARSWFAAIAHVLRTEDGEQARAFEAVTLGCAAD